MKAFPLGRVHRSRAGQNSVLVLSALLALLLACFLPGEFAHAAGTSGATKHAKKPTIVLVHGAWADPSSFGPITKRLQHAGYTVMNEPNPLRGLSSDAAYLDSFIAQMTKGPVVLVGHSYGGSVITDAALAEPRVKALVYVDAFAPAKGESVMDLSASVPSAPGTPSPFIPVKYPGAPAADYDLYFNPAYYPTVFANGVPAAAAKEQAVSQTPVTASALSEKSTAPAWAKLPSWYVLGTQDHVIVPALQLRMAKRAHSHITKVNGGHLSLLTHPTAVTHVIERAARSIG